MDLTASLRPAAPASVEEAFAAGDYVTAALHGRAEQWQYHAARGMIVDPLAGARALADFDTPEACFHRAACAWIGHDEDLACRLLERLDGPHARNLRDLIRRPRIDVLSQMPPMRNGPFVLLDGIAADRKFNLRNLGSGRGDVPLRPYESVHDFYDRASPPAFYVCSMVEWHEIPVDIGELPCPTIGYTSDFDAHILTVAPWLRVFDYMLTCDQLVEWRAVRDISGRPTFAYPIVFGAPRDLPPLSSRERDIDVFMSGTMISPYQPDKARLVHQLARVPGIKLLLLDGHVGLGEYFELLSRAKITPSFCRHPGAMLTRSIEALSMGSITLVQRDSPHLLWGGEEDGVFVYDEQVGPGPEIARILADYPRYAEGCRRGVDKIRRAFDAATVASRFFRFSTVVAARPLAPREQNDHRFLVQKRQIFIRGPWIELGHAVELCEANLGRLNQLDVASSAPQRRNDAARELMLLFGHLSYFNQQASRTDRLFERAVKILEVAAKEYPDHLILHFNLMRILLRFGDAAQRDRAIALALEIIDRPAAAWRVEPDDDVYPYDFNGSAVNSRDYYDLIVLHLAGRMDGRDGLRRILLASTLHALAVEWRRLSYARRAALLDPEFAPYRLTLAELLMEEPDGGARDEARTLLLGLADSIVAPRAHAQLCALGDGADARAAGRAEFAATVDQLHRSLLLFEHHEEKLTSRFLLGGRLRRAGKQGTLLHKQAPPNPGMRLSVIMCGQAGVGCRDTAQSLGAQSLPRHAYEIVHVECYDEPAPGMLAAADTVLSCNQDGFFEYRLVALNLALGLTHTPVVVAVEPGWRPPPDFLATIERDFYGDTPRRRVVIEPLAAWSGRLPHYVAFRPADAAEVGNFDEHQVFAGPLGSPYELAQRLFLAGVPCVELGGSVACELASWWKLPALAAYRPLLAMARTVSSRLLDEKRVSALLPRAVERTLVSPAADQGSPAVGAETPPLRSEIGLPSPLRGARAHLYRMFRRLGLAGDAAADRLAAGGAAASAVMAALMVIFKPAIYRALGSRRYLRLALWYRRRAGRL